MAVVWVLAQYGLKDIDVRFREAYYLQHQGDSEPGRTTSIP
jgi:hypothetical protein